jgi:hypothetical protein
MYTQGTAFSVKYKLKTDKCIKLIQQQATTAAAGNAALVLAMRRLPAATFLPGPLACFHAKKPEASGKRARLSWASGFPETGPGKAWD